MPLDYQDFPKQNINQKAHFSPIYQVNVTPTDRELELYVQKIQHIFSDKLHWKDIPLIMKIASHYLNDFPSLTLEERRSSVMYILNRVMDETEPSHLPDQYTGSLFEKMIPPFVEFIVPNSVSDFRPGEKISNASPNEMLLEQTDQIFNTFQGGFYWTDLTAVIRSGIVFANQFDHLHLHEKKKVAKELVDYVIDHGDASLFPESFNEAIFKELSYPCIDMIMDQLLILN